MRYELICAQHSLGRCGFRVHQRYFIEKTRFSPGICPRCGNPVKVVTPGTNDIVPGMMVSLIDGEIKAVPATP